MFDNNIIIAASARVVNRELQGSKKKAKRKAPQLVQCFPCLQESIWVIFLRLPVPPGFPEISRQFFQRHAGCRLTVREPDVFQFEPRVVIHGSGIPVVTRQPDLPRQEKFCCFAGGLLTAVLNTVFFMGALVLLFYNLPYVQDAAQSMGATNALMFVVLFVGVQAIGEWVTCCLVAGAVALPVRKFLKLN